MIWSVNLVFNLETIAGYTGDFTAIKDKIFDGIHYIDKNGVLGDPTLAAQGRGQTYIDDVVNYIADNLN